MKKLLTAILILTIIGCKKETTTQTKKLTVKAVSVYEVK